MCCTDELLQVFVEGALSAGEAQAVKAHVASCPACRIAVSEYKQVMWDLSHPPERELPAELERQYEALMEAWKRERRAAAKTKGSNLLVPAWAAHSIAWARKLPALGAAGALARRIGTSLFERAVPAWPRRKGGGRH